jgi:L-threonylcarbamoyladenylate synthase
MDDQSTKHTLTLSSLHPGVIQSVIDTLALGGLVAFPTDTVYGLAARIDQADAIENLFIAKGRDFNKPIAVLVGETEQIEQVAEGFTENAKRLVDRFWPGALTVIVTKRAGLPEKLSPTSTIGVRMPDHAFARALLTACGPLATTSANLSGRPNPITAADVLAQLDGRIDLLVDGGATPGGVPSTVVDCTVDPPIVLRHGAISDADIFSSLHQG